MKLIKFVLITCISCNLFSAMQMTDAQKQKFTDDTAPYTDEQKQKFTDDIFILDNLEKQLIKKEYTIMNNEYKEILKDYIINNVRIISDWDTRRFNGNMNLAKRMNLYMLSFIYRLNVNGSKNLIRLIRSSDYDTRKEIEIINQKVTFAGQTFHIQQFIDVLISSLSYVLQSEQ